MVGQLRFHEGILSLYLSMVDLDPSPSIHTPSPPFPYPRLVHREAGIGVGCGRYIGNCRANLAPPGPQDRPAEIQWSLTPRPIKMGPKGIFMVGRGWGNILFPALPIQGHPIYPCPPFHAWRSNPKSRKEGKGNVGPSLTGGWTQRMIRQYTVNLPCVTTKSMMDDGRDLP